MTPDVQELQELMHRSLGDLEVAGDRWVARATRDGRQLRRRRGLGVATGVAAVTILGTTVALSLPNGGDRPGTGGFATGSSDGVADSAAPSTDTSGGPEIHTGTVTVDHGWWNQSSTEVVDTLGSLLPAQVTILSARPQGDTEPGSDPLGSVVARLDSGAGQPVDRIHVRLLPPDSATHLTGGSGDVSLPTTKPSCPESQADSAERLSCHEVTDASAPQRLAGTVESFTIAGTTRTTVNMLTADDGVVQVTLEERADDDSPSLTVAQLRTIATSTRWSA